MSFRLPKLIACLLTSLLGMAFLLSGRALAQEHVVSPAELRSTLKDAAAARQANIARLERFFSSEATRKALATAKLDPAKVQKALPLLSDEELAQLAARAQQIQPDFAAGGVSLTNQQVTYIIIGAIAIAVIAIIAAH